MHFMKNERAFGNIFTPSTFFNLTNKMYIEIPSNKHKQICNTNQNKIKVNLKCNLIQILYNIFPP